MGTHRPPKPPGLGPGYAAHFADESVADAYAHRPPYPPEVFDILHQLMAGPSPRRVLDLGCGRGEIARALLGYLQPDDAVDAVDVSRAMIVRGWGMPGGRRVTRPTASFVRTACSRRSAHEACS